MSIVKVIEKMNKSSRFPCLEVDVIHFTWEVPMTEQAKTVVETDILLTTQGAVHYWGTMLGPGAAHLVFPNCMKGGAAENFANGQFYGVRNGIAWPQVLGLLLAPTQDRCHWDQGPEKKFNAAGFLDEEEAEREFGAMIGYVMLHRPPQAGDRR